MTSEEAILDSRLGELRRAALDVSPVQGLTHRFYRYPARFSPQFAGAAIEVFSRPGDLVLDPQMGGGTTVVEALVRGRHAVGNDLNSLAVFVARVKTTCLDGRERAALTRWAQDIVPALSYRANPGSLHEVICRRRTRNLSLPMARPIKKVIALAIHGLSSLPTEPCRNLARCALLNAAQLALNGRKRTTPLCEFRGLVRAVVLEMLAAVEQLRQRVSGFPAAIQLPTLTNANAANLAGQAPFAQGARADLVVTSPPYPGIHVLYHRWQVDGRRETPAPYWIAACNDGQGNAYYNFADRRDAAASDYFDESLRTLRALRQVVKDGAIVVQMVAFGDPKNHLRRYLANMRQAGFEEDRPAAASGGMTRRRIWRTVPRRRWHANLKGDLHSSREVVLVHRAV
jgi:hypothetical protein